MPPHPPFRAAGCALALLLLVACSQTATVPPVDPEPAVVAALVPPAPVPEPEPPRETPPPEDPLRELAREVLTRESAELDPEQCDAVAEVAADVERRHGIPVLLLMAVIAQESRFDPEAVGPRGALGLMQLRPFVAADVAERYGIDYEGRPTLFDPAENVTLGARYLAELQERFDSLTLALGAYNKGPTRAARDVRRGQTPGRRYVSRVFLHYDRLTEEYLPGPAEVGAQATPTE